MIEHKIPDVKKGLDQPIVSIVIPSYNSSSTIGMCIKSIKRQTYSRCEILVIDNNSPDNTSNIARQLGADVFAHLGKRTSARNYGAKKSSGKYLFHIDSDMELTPYVIEECVNKCEVKKLDALIVPEVSIGEGYWARCKSLQKQLLLGTPGYESARFLSRECFNKIGGYDENLEAGEDYDLHFRINGANFMISRTDTYILHHEKKITLKKIISKNIYYGKTMDNYVDKNKQYIKNQIPIPKLYIMKWEMLIANTILIPGLLVVLFIEFIFTGRHARFSKI